MRDYETVSNEFFDELMANGTARLTALFDEMLTTRVFKSSRELGRALDDSVLKALGGQISICDEFLTRLRMAWDAREAEAAAERDSRFRKEGSENAS